MSQILPATRWDSIESLLERIEENEIAELNECTKSWQIVLDNKACFRCASRYYLDFTGIDEQALLGCNFLTLVRGDISEAQSRAFNDQFHNHENIQDFLFSRTQPDLVGETLDEAKQQGRNRVKCFPLAT